MHKTTVLNGKHEKKRKKTKPAKVEKWHRKRKKKTNNFCGFCYTSARSICLKRHKKSTKKSGGSEAKEWLDETGLECKRPSDAKQKEEGDAIECKEEKTH
jgi:hypothetical protein